MNTGGPTNFQSIVGTITGSLELSVKMSSDQEVCFLPLAILSPDLGGDGSAGDPRR